MQKSDKNEHLYKNSSLGNSNWKTSNFKWIVKFQIKNLHLVFCVTKSNCDALLSPCCVIHWKLPVLTSLSCTWRLTGKYHVFECWWRCDIQIWWRSKLSASVPIGRRVLLWINLLSIQNSPCTTLLTQRMLQIKKRRKDKRVIKLPINSLCGSGQCCWLERQALNTWIEY